MGMSMSRGEKNLQMSLGGSVPVICVKRPRQRFPLGKGVDYDTRQEALGTGNIVFAHPEHGAFANSARLPKPKRTTRTHSGHPTDVSASKYQSTIAA